MNFPRTEPDMTALCTRMIAGLTTHGGEFSAITPAMIAEMQAAMADYRAARDTQAEAQTNAHVATTRKAECLERLVELMKANIKRAEIDCNLPEKLGFIGWGPRQETYSVPAPAEAPTSLTIIAEGSGDICFQWRQGRKRRIKNWIIERRDQLAPGAEFGPWLLAGTSVNTQAHLKGQPCGVKMEYRVKAVTVAGESRPGNTVAAVL